MITFLTINNQPNHKTYVGNFSQYICLTSVTRAKPKEKMVFPLNFYNGINWTGAFSKAFGSSEALISVLSKNGHLISAMA